MQIAAELDFEIEVEVELVVGRRVRWRWKRLRRTEVVFGGGLLRLELLDVVACRRSGIVVCW